MGGFNGGFPFSYSHSFRQKHTAVDVFGNLKSPPVHMARWAMASLAYRFRKSLPSTRKLLIRRSSAPMRKIIGTRFITGRGPSNQAKSPMQNAASASSKARRGPEVFRPQVLHDAAVKLAFSETTASKSTCIARHSAVRESSVLVWTSRSRGWPSHVGFLAGLLLRLNSRNGYHAVAGAIEVDGRGLRMTSSA